VTSICSAGRRGLVVVVPPSAPRAPAEAVAEEVGEELVEEAAPASEGDRRAAALTLKLPEVLFADGDRSLFAVLPDPHACDGGPTPVDLAHRGGHENLLAAGSSAREGLAYEGARLVEKTRPRKCTAFQPLKHPKHTESPCVAAAPRQSRSGILHAAIHDRSTDATVRM
jgi:cell division septation protein DedD